MKHTFLMDAGRWTFKGHWLERDQAPQPIEGKILVAWSQDNWFTMISKLLFLGPSPGSDLIMKYKGRLDSEARHYTFVLQHSQLGPVEGEGWIAPTSIVQRFWSLEDRQRRGGFETIHYVNDNHYLLSSSIMAGHSLLSTLEATLNRQT
ncbi:hypothetical protein C1752_04379 [Acaryochloris thomasi RCC1774]|uniref:DUF3598 domain-containing protein n=1 Tax=Acaryochloris thomasi RCC1774 TaxID=1764569 RepID=A0A2W1JE27_9CYAN|nr:hypothetical protein [Acaryochloris thomasi]PZD71976.1 hypothetical protein C1752_04379 [Acaryochloris thomasi RCC1774]